MATAHTIYDGTIEKPFPFKSMDLITFFIPAIVFIATLVRSTFGFGESLIAVPLFILLISISD